MQNLIIYIFIISCCSSSIISIKISPCARWNKTGITIAGTGERGNSTNELNRPLGISIHKPTNTLYVADTFNYRIQKIDLNQSSTAGTTFAKTEAEPRRIFVDDDNEPIIYVSFSIPAHRVEKWISGANPIRQVVDTCDFCSGISIDKEKNIYMVESAKDRVVKWSSNTHTIEVVAGLANYNRSLDERLSMPNGIYIDKISDSLYIADSMLHRIQKWSKDAKQGNTIAGSINGVAGSDIALLSNPNAVLVDEETETIYIADTGNRRIQRWQFNASEGETIIGNEGENNQFKSPTDLAFDNTGNLYVCDSQNNRVQMFMIIENQLCYDIETHHTEATTPANHGISIHWNQYFKMTIIIAIFFII